MILGFIITTKVKCVCLYFKKFPEKPATYALIK